MFHQTSARLVIICLAIYLVGTVCSTPIIDSYDFTSVCIKNCVQCKKMLGGWFEAEKCANSCIDLNGKFVPDCQDLMSIAPFINRLERR